MVWYIKWDKSILSQSILSNICNCPVISVVITCKKKKTKKKRLAKHVNNINVSNGDLNLFKMLLKCLCTSIMFTIFQHWPHFMLETKLQHLICTLLRKWSFRFTSVYIMKCNITKWSACLLKNYVAFWVKNKVEVKQIQNVKNILTVHSAVWQLLCEALPSQVKAKIVTVILTAHWVVTSSGTPQ